MSVQLMAQVWADKSIQSRTDLLVLLAIADFSGEHKPAWPSIDTLAQKARCSQRAVHGAIWRLKRANKLSVEYGSGPNGTNLYRVIDGGVQDLHPADTGSKIGSKNKPLAAPNPSGTVRNHHEPKKNNLIMLNKAEGGELKLPNLEAIGKLHATYCQESGLDVPLDTELGYDKWGRKRAWHDFLKDGFTEADLVLTIRYIKRTMKDPFRVQCLNFRKLIEGSDYFGEQRAAALAEERNRKKPLTNREQVLAQSGRPKTELMPEPVTPAKLLQGDDLKARLDALRKAAG